MATPTPLLTPNSHPPDCPHCLAKARKPPAELPDIVERPKRPTKAPTFTAAGFPAPSKTYASIKRKPVASSETVAFLQALHADHPSCVVDATTVSANASWMGYTQRPATLPEPTLATLRFGFVGEVLEPSVEVDAQSGLYNHGKDPWAAGYTLEEIGMLLRSNITAQLRAMIGVVSAIAGRCNGVVSTIKYPAGDTMLEFGGGDPTSRFYWGRFTKKAVFRALWLDHDAFASLCEVVLAKENACLPPAIDALHALVVPPAGGLLARAVVLHAFRQPSHAADQKDIVEHYLSLGVVGKLLQHAAVLPAATARHALELATALLRLGPDYVGNISIEEKKAFVAQVASRSSLCLKVGQAAVDAALAAYLYTSPDVLPVTLPSLDAFLPTLSAGAPLPDTPHLLLLTALLHTDALSLDSPEAFHTAPCTNLTAFQFLQETIHLLPTNTLSELYASADYSTIPAGHLLVAYAAELVRRGVSPPRRLSPALLPPPSPASHPLRIAPLCRWQFDSPHVLLLLLTATPPSTIPSPSSPVDRCASALLTNDYSTFLLHLPRLCSLFARDAFTLLVHHLLSSHSLFPSSLSTYLLTTFLSRFTNVPIPSFFPDVPDLLSIGLCSLNPTIIADTLTLYTSLLPHLSQPALLAHYESLFVLLKSPDALFPVDAHLISSYISAFSSASRTITFDVLAAPRSAVRHIPPPQSETDEAPQDDLLLMQQSPAYQRIVERVRLFTESSLNHPLLCYIVLGLFHPHADFIEALRYNISGFPSSFPFSPSTYLHPSDNPQVVAAAVQAYKRSSSWTGAFAAVLSALILSSAPSEAALRFYDLTASDAECLRTLVSSVLGVSL